MRIALPVLVLLGCTPSPPPAPPPPPEPERPDVVVVTIDTLRADRLGCYGDPLARTPHLDALARESVLFREATTPVPLTLPAHTSLFSGRYPSTHGMRDNGGFHVDDQVPLLAEALRGAGYQTGGFVAAYVLDGSWGLERGFDRYFDDFHPQDVIQASRFGAVERPAREVVREALAWFEDEARGDNPRFLWVHLFDPHTPYEPPVDWSGDPYRGEVFSVDRALRPLLQAVPDDALLVVTSDHGENLWDGRELEHGIVLTRSTTRVPLLVRPPGGVEGEDRPAPRELPPRPGTWRPVPGLSPEGLVLDVVPDAPVAARVVDTPVSLVDLAPTILDLAGLEPLPGAHGRSLLPALSGGELAERPVYSETVAPYTHFGWAPQHVARDATRLLRDDAGRQVFDPVADPWWQAPLEEPPPDALAQAIDTFRDGWDRPGGALDATTAQALQALGYQTSTVDRQGPRPSARDRIDHMHRLDLAQGHMKSRPAETMAELEALLAEDPALIDAWFALASLRWTQGELEGAATALEEVVERAPEHPLAWNNLLLVLRDQGKLEEALRAAGRLVEAQPEDPRWHRHRVDLLGRMERPLEVAAAAEQALERFGPDPYFAYMLGLSRLQADDAEGALQMLKVSKESGTRAPDVDLWMGHAHQKLGQVDAAVAAYKAQANATPDDIRPTVAAGMLLVEEERCTDALPLLFTAIQRGVRDPRVRAAYDACGGF
jgi:choline-sulfatase